MNILFFLTPKSEVAYIFDDYTVRQALEKMEYHRYSAVPVLNRQGEYVGTITEGDFLWTYKHNLISGEKIAIEHIPVSNIPRRIKNQPIGANANIEDLFLKASNQNFVPVVDDKNVFIGIVTRKDIIQYCINCANDAEAAKSDVSAASV
ncbi:CBS domain-containing protein [Anaerolentibacter hominis]|uniref:CBS domain-containing protein n=1 Tax=Anaerolentibacter hominis TaxID=3079009 RepID=UPI0031B838AC